MLFRDPAVGRFYKHNSPYTYFSSDELHLGEISLECSRPGAAAVALWATQRMLPLERGGVFRNLEACREGALALYAGIAGDKRFVPLAKPELDIVVWAVRRHCARGIRGGPENLRGRRGARTLSSVGQLSESDVRGAGARRSVGCRRLNVFAGLRHEARASRMGARAADPIIAGDERGRPNLISSEAPAGLPGR